MKVRHLLLLLSRHRITVTLSGVLIITVVSSLVFVQNVFGQNPIIQMYETIRPYAAAASAGTDAVSAEPSSDIKSLSDTMKESTPETSAEATPAATAPITAQETTAAASAESAAPVVTAKPAKPSSTVTVTAKKARTQTIQETVPAETAAETEAAPPAETPAGTFDSTMASAVLDVVNRIRSDNALPALVWNDSLTSSAQIRAQEIVVCWEKDHRRPDGSAWWTAGDQLQMAENLGKEQSSAEGVVSDWMASSTHAANILNGTYSNMGVACYYCSGTYYWVQEFY